MSQNKKTGIIIDYDDFLKISAEIKQKMLNNSQVVFFVSIKKEKYEQISVEEKKQLEFFRCTEREPLRAKIPDMEKFFENIKLPEIADFRLIEKEMKEKHKKQSKPYVPLKIGTICTKKKGGR